MSLMMKCYTINSVQIVDLFYENMGSVRNVSHKFTVHLEVQLNSLLKEIREQKKIVVLSFNKTC